MRKLLLAAVLALSVPTTSQAIVSLGLRLGVGFPGGDIVKDTKYSDGVSNQVPVQVDVMFGSPSLQLGIYGGWAHNSIKSSAFAAGETATSSTMRAGLQVTSELVDLGLVGVWAGLGTGYESLQINVDTPAGKVESTLRGWEFATLSAGADLKFIPLVSVGLYGSAAFGQFGAGTTKTPAGDASGGIGPNKAIHQMYTIGLRGALNL
jgi:hypothetical protein